MKQHKVSIGGESFALAFTMDALDMIESMIPDFNMSTVSQYTRRAGAMVDILYAMVSQGELLEGRKLEKDRAWFGSHIPAAPRKIAEIQVAIYNTIADAIKTENETDEKGEIDVTLEEIKKNGEKGA